MLPKIKRSLRESWSPPDAGTQVSHTHHAQPLFASDGRCSSGIIMRHLTRYSLLGLVGVSVAFFTGCISKNVGSTLADAIIGQIVAPPIELSLSAHNFRQAAQRWPTNYSEFSAFLKKSGEGVQLRHYDRIDFTEHPDGSLEIYAVAPDLTNRMTITVAETGPK